ncbi:hypothetical protein E2C01_073854 [Portunus trituberculatus]|uniref:Uncharacterized protein n=1 Tax=Portunus trituberculatus TaxID=210409 RepID=A0A5B7I1U6_PORTR|nr:hypothetical protein [Portunus trituberculatus]
MQEEWGERHQPTSHASVIRETSRKPAADAEEGTGSTSRSHKLGHWHFMKPDEAKSRRQETQWRLLTYTESISFFRI